ncbi:helix-turn-helix domain-containing protein [Enterococcus sp. ZJ1668]|uniref:helix-turn-helix domain-containing protein n=1 Tax=Enterococcus sp. ZJ1668 TaxID=2709402 RepID=UPI0013EA847F|nr:helix-turn-helix domain-containing protein [Enterococcus sp. ZJ1668]
MNVINLLEKEDRRKIDLFCYLENSPMLAESKLMLMKELGFSEFVLEKVIQGLIDDIEKQQLADFFKIEIEEHQIFLREYGGATSEILIKNLLRESLSVKIILLLFKQEFKSINRFAKDHFSSYTAIYKKMKTIETFLVHYGVRIGKKYQLIGDEKTIRLFFTEFYKEIFETDFSDLYSEELLQNNQLYIEKITNSKLRMTKHQEYLLLHYMCVAVLRGLQSGVDYSKLDTDYRKYFLDIIEESSPELCSLILSWSEEHFDKQTEGHLLAEFMLVEEIIPDSKHLLSEIFASSQEVEALTRIFLDYFRTEFQMSVKKKEKLIQSIKPSIDLLHFKINYFFLEQMQLSKKMDVSYFFEANYEIFEFCRTFLIDAEKKGLSILVENREFLFKEYLFILTLSIPTSMLNEEITVCIDFSFGDYYNRIIERDLHFFSNFNIQVVNTVSSQTDLILSDSTKLYESSNIKQIVWLAPPRPVDWSNLGDALVAIRRRKNQER